MSHQEVLSEKRKRAEDRLELARLDLDRHFVILEDAEKHLAFVNMEIFRDSCVHVSVEQVFEMMKDPENWTKAFSKDPRKARLICVNDDCWTRKGNSVLSGLTYHWFFGTVDGDFGGDLRMCIHCFEDGFTDCLEAWMETTGDDMLKELVEGKGSLLIDPKAMGEKTQIDILWMKKYRTSRIDHKAREEKRRKTVGE